MKTDTVDILTIKLDSTRDLSEKVEVLNELSRSLLRSNPQQALYYAQEALNTAKELGSDLYLAKSLHGVGVCHNAFSSYEKSLDYLREALSLFEQLENYEGAASVLHDIGIIYALKGRNREALEVFHRSAELRETYSGTNEILQSLNALGILYGEIGKYQTAVDYFLRGLNLASDNREMYSGELGAIYNNLGNLYYWMRDFDKALSHYTRASEHRVERGDKLGEAQSFGNMAGIYLERNEWDEALVYLRRARTIFQQYGNANMHAQTLNNIGLVYMRQGNYPTALAYLYRSLQVIESVQRTFLYPSLLHDIGHIYLKLGNYSEALYFLEDALQNANLTQERKVQYEIHALLAETFEKMQDIPKAFEHYRLYATMKEEVQNSGTQKHIAEMQLRFDVEQAEKEREIARKEKALVEQEREILRLKNEQLELEMDLKSKELTMVAMYLAQKNELLVRMRRKLQQMKKEDAKSDQDGIRELLGQVDESIGAEENWAMFEQQFQQVHQDFLYRLAELHPTLSPTELKVCSLIKINLSTKEMARLLCQSTRSIESYRYRVRKKLKIAPDANLTLYLMAL